MLLAAIIGGLSLASCDKITQTASGESADAVAAGTYISAPTKALIGVDIPVSVKQPSEMRDVTWAIVLAGKDTPVEVCSASQGVAILCRFGGAGDYEIRMNAVTASNKTLADRKGIRILDPGVARGQAPVITLQLKDAAGQVISTIATFSEEESGANVVSRGVPVTLDFSQTVDDRSKLEALTFEIETDASGFRVVPVVSQVIWPSTGIFPVKVRVKDTEEGISEKMFTVYVQCSALESSPLLVDQAKVLVTPSTDVSRVQSKNYFLYDATGAVRGGGGGPYKFMWDYNGDGIFDSGWKILPSVDNIFSAYMHQRQVSLKVWDTTCNMFASVVKSVNLPLTFTDGVAGTPQGPQQDYDMFLQGVVRGLDGYSSPMANVDFAATRAKALSLAADPKNVVCDFRRLATATSASDGASQSSFKVLGRANYRGTDMGMDLTISSFADPTYGGLAQVIASGGSVTINRNYRVRFYTDESADSATRRIFEATSGCSIQMSVNTLQGAGTCSTAPSEGFVALIDGTVSCPELREPSGKRIQITQGAFYCEVAKVSACPPGGGGGGGGLPVIPQ
jgi:hypothetical protein